MPILRPFLSLCLACLIALTSVQMAQARGQARPVGIMVLCIGTETRTVSVDANGQPVEAPHLCPDCVMALMAALPGEESAVGELDGVSVGSPLAVFFGNEEEGLTAAVREEVAEHIRIPMFGFTKSFNISVSAALILRELTRRMRSSPVPWQLSDEEKQSLRLKWYRRMVKGSDLLEQRYLKERAR